MGKSISAWARDREAKKSAREEEAEAARAELERRRADRSREELRKLNKALARELEFERAKNEALLEITTAKADVYRIARPAKNPRKNRAVAVAGLSDLHVEERVEKRKVNGLNEHNLAIAEAKLERAFQNIAKLVKKEQHDADIRTLILWLGGDLFSGHIHEDLVEVCELSPAQAIIWLRERLTAGIKYLLAELDVERIHIPCSFGNHGRTTMKSRVSTLAEHSWEWLLYQVLQSDFASEPRIKFQIADGYHTYVDVGGFIIRFHHGDYIGYQGGVGGLTIPLRKAVDAWNQAQHADFDFIGHWHQRISLEWVEVNGSLIGWSPFSIRVKARFEKPKMSFVLIDLERRCKTGSFPVFVT